MGRETKPKTLHYRHAKFMQHGGNLEQLLGAALAKFSLVGQRMEELSATHVRTINNHLAQLDMEFGNMLSYEAGTNRMLLSVDKNVGTKQAR